MTSTSTKQSTDSTSGPASMASRSRERYVIFTFHADGNFTFRCTNRIPPEFGPRIHYSVPFVRNLVEKLGPGYTSRHLTLGLSNWVSGVLLSDICVALQGRIDWILQMASRFSTDNSAGLLIGLIYYPVYQNENEPDDFELLNKLCVVMDTKVENPVIDGLEEIPDRIELGESGSI